MTLGELLKAKRNAAKFTLEELSELADVSKSYLHAIENGESFPSIYICAKLSLALNVSVQAMALSVITNPVESKTSEPENV